MKRLSAVFILGTIVLFPAAPSRACLMCLAHDETHFDCVSQPTGFNECNARPSSCMVYGPCSGGNGCFLAGTMVAVPGGEKPIELLEAGDEVLSVVESTGEIVVGKVTRSYRLVQCGYVELNGGLVKATSSHPFLVNGAWRTTEELQVGDALMTQAGEAITISSIEGVSRGVRVYNIEVAGTSTFFANGVLVHNKSHPGEE